MSLAIDGILLPHAAILAPMSGVTDRPFRRAVRRAGGGLVVTEMVASAAVLKNVRPEMRKLRIEAIDEAPLSIQLVGWEPPVMAEAARFCADLGATFIDINMGCPTKKVTGKLSGSALMRDPHLAAAIMKAVTTAVSVPATLKMRLGWDSDSINAPYLAKIAADNGIKMLAVHGRTRCQMYNGVADWALVGDVVDAVDIPVVVNGDINSLDAVSQSVAVSRAAGVMIGRGAQGRPWLLGQAGDLLMGLTPKPAPSVAARHRLMCLHLDDMLTHYGNAAMRLARKHIAWYAHGLPGAAELRDVANNSTAAKDVFAAVDQFFKSLIRKWLLLDAHLFKTLKNSVGDVGEHKKTPKSNGFGGNDVSATQILSTLPTPLFVLDKQNRFIYLNQAGEMFFKSSKTMLAGMSLENFVQHDSSLFSMLQRAREQHLSVGDQGLEIANPKIGLKLVNVQITPFGDAPPYLLVSIQERALAERLRGQSLFRGAARSISSMAALLAHEVKNPLAGIKGAAQLLEAGLGDDERALTRMIVEETDRVTALLNRMEDFAGGNSLTFNPVNIHEVLDHCLRLAAASFGAHVIIKRRYDPSLPNVYGHRDLLIQAFINIIKNASEATDKNAEIILITSYSHGRRLSMAANDGGSYLPVQVEVIDNGRGIPEELRDHVFDPFVSGRNGGKGLGLTMVASVVADHGGMIEVESVPGRTAFRLNFPIALSKRPVNDKLVGA